MKPRRRHDIARRFAAAALAAAGCAACAQPLGEQGGASRQAWAAAAALSRGMALDFPAESGPGAADAPAGGEGAACGLLARAGLRTVRLTVPQPPSPPDLRRLDLTVDTCLSAGLTVVLGLRPVARALSGAAAWSSETEHRAFIAAWRRLASRYADKPPRLLFEVAFAPGSPAVSKNALSAEVLTQAIRPANPTRVVVLSWSDSIGLSQLRLPGDSHLIVGVASDEPHRFTRQGAPSLPQSHQWRGTGCCTPQERRLMALPVDAAKTWSDAHRYPVWLAEFMSHKDIPQPLRARHARLMREIAEERGIPWAYGDFNGDFGAYDTTAPRGWRPALLQALTGP